MQYIIDKTYFSCRIQINFEIMSDEAKPEMLGLFQTGSDHKADQYGSLHESFPEVSGHMNENSFSSGFSANWKTDEDTSVILPPGSDQRRLHSSHRASEVNQTACEDVRSFCTKDNQQVDISLAANSENTDSVISLFEQKQVAEFEKDHSLVTIDCNSSDNDTCSDDLQQGFAPVTSHNNVDVCPQPVLRFDDNSGNNRSESGLSNSDSVASSLYAASSDTRPLIVEEANSETALRIFAELLFPFLLAGLGCVFAGLVLGIVKVSTYNVLNINIIIFTLQV